MARFVVLTDYLGARVAVNPEWVVEFHRRESKQDCVDILLINSTAADDQIVLTVKGTFSEVMALLTGPVVRLHPSILVDDQPPAWSTAKPTIDGGAS